MNEIHEILTSFFMGGVKINDNEILFPTGIDGDETNAKILADKMIEIFNFTE